MWLVKLLESSPLDDESSAENDVCLARFLFDDHQRDRLLPLDRNYDPSKLGDDLPLLFGCEHIVSQFHVNHGISLFSYELMQALSGTLQPPALPGSGAANLLIATD